VNRSGAYSMAVASANSGSNARWRSELCSRASHDRPSSTDRMSSRMYQSDTEMGEPPWYTHQEEDSDRGLRAQYRNRLAPP
jgi:hypothetical protein